MTDKIDEFKTLLAQYQEECFEFAEATSTAMGGQAERRAMMDHTRLRLIAFMVDLDDDNRNLRCELDDLYARTPDNYV